MPSQEKQTIEIGGELYDETSLSADALTSIAIIRELDGKINGFRKEAHYLEITRGAYESQLSRQLPSKSLKNGKSEQNDDKQDKNGGKPTDNGTKSG